MLFRILALVMSLRITQFVFLPTPFIYIFGSSSAMGQVEWVSIPAAGVLTNADLPPDTHIDFDQDTGREHIIVRFPYGQQGLYIAKASVDWTAFWFVYSGSSTHYTGAGEVLVAHGGACTWTSFNSDNESLPERALEGSVTF